MVFGSGCSLLRPEIPGHTPLTIGDVTFEGSELDLGILPTKLALRPQSFFLFGQTWNPYRAAEDRKRIRAWWNNFGYFDATVRPPVIERDDENQSVSVAWTIDEGPFYAIGSVAVKGLDGTEGAAHRDALEAMVPFEVGGAPDLDKMRLSRQTLNAHLRRAGLHHAETYTRAFVDRTAHKVHLIYFVDAGPQTVVGTVKVEGNERVASADILARAGLTPGEPFDLGDRDQAELDLYDTGSFNLVRIVSTADNEFLLPDLPPDRGGVMKPEMIGAEGQFLHRALNPALDITITVAEAPTVQGRVGVGGAVDPARVDAYAFAGITLRDIFGAGHHLSMGGRIGYGVHYQGRAEGPFGLWGDAELRYDHPGLFARVADLRIVARFEDRLYPDFHARRALGTIGLMVTPTADVHLDITLGGRWEQTAGLNGIDGAEATRLALSTDDAIGAEVGAAVVWDTRDNPMEAKNGHLLALRATYSPGGPLGSARWVRLGAEARGFIPITDAISIGVRVAGDFILAADPKGIPAGVRLFGGGAHAMRGSGLDELTVRTQSCGAGGLNCAMVGVGALSLLEAQLELRWLPWRQQVGAALWLDFGAAGEDLNPFSATLGGAVGLGARIRTWHFPVSLDFGVNYTDPEGTPFEDRLRFFVRIGESF